MRNGIAAIAAILAGLGLQAADAVAAGVSGDAVKIGVLNDQSGLYADIAGQGSILAARMAVEDFGGTVLGKPVEIVSADHQNKADIGSAIANRWIDTEGVDAIFDVPSSGVALAVQEITRNKKKVFVAVGPATSDLTGKACSPTGFAWMYDTYMLANGTGAALAREGGDSWFFVTADYAFGHALERDTTAAVKAAGGSVKGSVYAPLNNADFSSFLLQAQGSGAKIVGLATAGGDTVNAIKQAHEFGVGADGSQRLAGLLVFLTDVHSIGLDIAQGLVLTESFYWDLDEGTRAWSKRFMERSGGKAPTMIHAGVYSAVAHYLKAIAAEGGDDGTAVAARMRALPVEDFTAKGAAVRADGRVVRDAYMFQVKTPAESKGPWDYYKLITRIPADAVTRPLAESECPLVRK